MKLLKLILFMALATISVASSQIIEGEEFNYVTLYKLKDVFIEFKTPCRHMGEVKKVVGGETTNTVIFEEYGIKRDGTKLYVNNKVYLDVPIGAKIRIIEDDVIVNGKKMQGEAFKHSLIRKPEVYRSAAVDISFSEDASSFGVEFYNKDNAIFHNGLLVVKIWNGKLIIWGKTIQDLKPNSKLLISGNGVVTELKD